MNEESEISYHCVGVCMADPETGICMGCGRPPLGTPDVTVEVVSLDRERAVHEPLPAADDPDHPSPAQ